jgi:molybdopterin converting factor small subunit
MSIRIDNSKRKALKIIASIEGKSMGGIVSELIEDYIKLNKTKLSELAEVDNLNDIMNLSTNSFMEWDNKEDEIYNEL